MIILFSVVIALAVALFLFGAIASTLLEIIAAVFAMRGSHLRATLSQMLGKEWCDQFFAHPFYRQIARQHLSIRAKQGLPDKLNKRTFALILLDVLGLERGKDPMPVLYALPESETRQMLLFLGRQAGYNVDRLRVLTENWWEEMMKGSTAQYRRKAQWALFAIGCVLAILFNADIFQMYGRFSRFAVQSLEATFLGEAPGITMHFFGWNTQGWPSWLLKIVGFLLTGLGVAFCAPVWFDWAKKWLYRRGGQIWEDHTDDSLAEAIATGLELEAAKNRFDYDNNPASDAFGAMHDNSASTENRRPEHHEDTEMQQGKHASDFPTPEGDRVVRRAAAFTSEREAPVFPTFEEIPVVVAQGEEPLSAPVVGALPDDEAPIASPEGAQSAGGEQDDLQPGTSAPPPLTMAPPIEMHKLNWALRSGPIVGEWWEKENIRGQNISVALLGTGVLSAHPDLEGAIADTSSFDGDSVEEYPMHIGTQAALIVAARGHFSWGVAPAAHLLIFKTGKNERETQTAGLIAGLEWALDKKADIVAILTDFREMSPTEKETLKALIQIAVAEGVLILAPVGNSTSPKPETRFPAALDGVLCVGAHGPDGQRSMFSARSYDLDLLAPGQDLHVPEPNGNYRLNLRDTSLATAYMAGIGALLKQQHVMQGKIFDPHTLIKSVRDTAIPHKIITKGNDVEYGYGILNPVK